MPHPLMLSRFSAVEHAKIPVMRWPFWCLTIPQYSRLRQNVLDHITQQNYCPGNSSINPHPLLAACGSTKKFSLLALKFPGWKTFLFSGVDLASPDRTGQEAGFASGRQPLNLRD